MNINTFKSSERLKSSKDIGELFSSGNIVISLPFRLYWKQIPIQGQGHIPRIAISVSSKNFKKSVDRNLLKRRIREAYRISKHDLYDYLSNNNFSLIFVLLYLPKTIYSYQQILKGLIKILGILKSQVVAMNLANNN